MIDFFSHKRNRGELKKIESTEKYNLISFINVALLSFSLGALLLIASAFGAKWFIMVLGAYLALSALFFFKDIRLFSLCLLSASLSIGISYQLWTHGSKHFVIKHFGGAPPEPIINLADFSIFLLIIIWIIDITLNKKKIPPCTHFDYGVLVFLFFSLLSIYNSTNFLLLFFEFSRYIKFYILYWTLRTYLNKPIYVWYIFGVTLLTLALQGIVALAQYFLFLTLPFPVGGVASTHFIIRSGEVIQRVTGLVGHANTFAAYLIIPLSIALVLFFARISILYKFAIVPFFFLGYLALLLTFSRNGWFTFALSLCVILFVYFKKKRLPKTFFTFMLGLLLFLMGIFYSIGYEGFTLQSNHQHRTNNSIFTSVINVLTVRIFEGLGQTLNSRSDLFSIAVKMVKENPIIGIGLNSFEENMISYDSTGITNLIQRPVHNIYMLIAAETGIPCSLAFIAMGLILINYSWDLVKRNNELFIIVGSLGLSVFTGTAFINIFDLSLRNYTIIGYMTIISAMVVTSFTNKRWGTKTQ